MHIGNVLGNFNYEGYNLNIYIVFFAYRKQVINSNIIVAFILLQYLNKLGDNCFVWFIYNESCILVIFKCLYCFLDI